MRALPLRLPHRGPYLLLAAYFFLAASLWNLLNPAFEAPDEVGHFAFLQHLVTERSLPRLRPGETGEAHQPPLYYFLAALATLPADWGDPTGAFRPNPGFVWAGQGGTDRNAARHGTAETFPYRGQALALHLARQASVLMGLGTVLLTVAAGRRLFPGRREIALLAGALVAALPQFQFLSAAINNDNLATLLATAALLPFLRLLESPDRPRDWAALGVLVALGGLTKASGIVPALAGGALALGWALRVRSDRRRAPRLLLGGLAALALPSVLLTGWWFARNAALYGDPLAYGAYREVFAANLRTTPFSLAEARALLSTQFRSFVGLFGWMTLPLPAPVYGVAAGLAAAGLGGLGTLFLPRRRGDLAPRERRGLLALGGLVVLQEAYIAATLVDCNASCHQGRYLFPAIAPLMLLLAAGLVHLLPRRRAPLLAGVLAVALALAALAVPLRVVPPAYRGVPLDKWSLWRVPVRTDLAYGDEIRLRGYALEGPGAAGALRVTLYWQALRPPERDYCAAVHLLDASGAVLAQDDRAPGADRGYPPSLWRAEDLVAETHTLPLPPGASGEGVRVRVGLYDWASGEHLLAGAGPFVTLGAEGVAP